MRVSVVGVGKVALTQYLPYLSGLPGIELGLWNRDATRAESAAAQFGGQTLHSLEEVLAFRPELAFVLSSERARLDLATVLVEGGVPELFLEKPLSARDGQANVSEDDFDEAKAFVQLCEARGVVGAMNFNYRSFAATQQVLEWQRTRPLGAMTGVTARAHFACWSHTLDLVSLFGGAPTRVAALAGSVIRTGRGMTAPDLAISFESDSGVTGTVMGSVADPWDHSLLDLSMVFEAGRIRLWDLDGGAELALADTPYVESLALGHHVSRWDRYSASFAAALDAYFAARKTTVDPPVPLRAGLAELRFEAAIRRAVRLGTVIDVQEEFPL